MSIADALRALAPLARPFTTFTTSAACRAVSCANDGQPASSPSDKLPHPHAAWHQSCVVHQPVAHQPAHGQQLSLLDTPADITSAARPLELIRRQRSASRRPRSQTHSPYIQATLSNLASPVQQCSSAAANDALVKTLSAPAVSRADRPNGWVIAGRMADVYAELTRLEQLERAS